MIKAYTGKTGSGKTYLMVKEAYWFWLQGRDIYSNTVLNFQLPLWEKVRRKTGFKPREYGRVKYFENITEVLDIKDGLIIFDEAQVLFNARQWESLPEEFQYKLQQHRKHQIDLLATTQNMGTIDISYRRLVHSWVHCRNLFQIGSSPKIWFGVFRKEDKDIDMLYNTVDDLVVDTISSKLFIINWFSKTLYDTMYDIGFRKFKTVWITEFDKMMKKKEMYLILPKKLSLKDAYRDIRLYQSLLKLRK